MMRIAANLVSIFAIALLPWWAASVALFAFLALFDFFEIIVYGFILDMLYGAPEGIFRAHGFLIVSIIVYAASLFVRPRLKEV